MLHAGSCITTHIFLEERRRQTSFVEGIMITELVFICCFPRKCCFVSPSAMTELTSFQQLIEMILHSGLQTFWSYLCRGRSSLPVRPRCSSPIQVSDFVPLLIAKAAAGASNIPAGTSEWFLDRTTSFNLSTQRTCTITLDVIPGNLRLVYTLERSSSKHLEDELP